jgi:glycerol-3-phosphate cytidylyltransferase
MKKKILVDMSITLLHHGHIRLLKKASKIGYVVVGLTDDKEIKKYKGYYPELSFKFRKEILKSIKYVDKVVKTKFVITKKVLVRNKIDFLIHGNDLKNFFDKKYLKIFKRTGGVSSSLLRKKSAKIYKILNEKNVKKN